MSKVSKMIAEQFGPRIVRNVAGDIKSTREWLTLGQDMHGAGITCAMLTKGTEKAPNDAFDEEAFIQLYAFVLAGVTAGNPGYRFPFAPPGAPGAAILATKKLHVWTAQEIVGLTREGMNLIPKTIEGNEFRAHRKAIQATAKTMVNRVIAYIDRFENPDKERAPKTKDAGAVSDNMPDAGTYSGAIQRIEQVMQNAAKLPAIDAVSLAFVQNHCEELLVSLRAAQKKADKLAK